MVERLKDARSSHALTAAPMALDRALAESYAWELPPALRELEPLALLLEMNRRDAALEREGRPITGPGLPAFCDGDERFSSDDCLRMPG